MFVAFNTIHFDQGIIYELSQHSGQLFSRSESKEVPVAGRGFQICQYYSKC